MYRLCGNFIHKKWNFKCFLENKRIGKGLLRGEVIVIRKKRVKLYFHEHCVSFRFMDISINNSNDMDPTDDDCEVQGFGEPVVDLFLDKK